MTHTKEQSMEGPLNQKFDLWLKDEIALIQLDDIKLTQKVLKKIQSTQIETASPSETWTDWSWILCAMTLGSLLAQYLTKIDPDTLTGPVVESLILLVAMMGAAWQCQRTWGSSH